ncbi:MAG: hypothetical protein H7222_03765 [Methylotenera sp.]|nr:hypothetical protein [Oligoflexia bacterium]
MLWLGAVKRAWVLAPRPGRAALGQQTRQLPILTNFLRLEAQDCGMSKSDCSEACVYRWKFTLLGSSPLLLVAILGSGIFSSPVQAAEACRSPCEKIERPVEPSQETLEKAPSCRAEDEDHFAKLKGSEKCRLKNNLFAPEST